MPFRWKTVQIRGSKPYLSVGSSELKGHISRFTPKRVNNLGQERCFFCEIRYPGEPQIPFQSCDIALDKRFNQNQLYHSLSFSASFRNLPEPQTLALCCNLDLDCFLNQIKFFIFLCLSKTILFPPSLVLIMLLKNYLL